MTRAGRSGSHRSKKKRLVLALAPVAALAVAIPLMANAGAATPSQVDADCKNDSNELENCEFVPVQNKANSFGPNERVSAVESNCGFDTEERKSFSVAAEVTRVIQTESGSSISGGTKLGNSVFEIGVQFAIQDINIKRDDTTTGISFTRNGTMQPDHIAFFMWSHKRTDVSGFLRATYKKEQDGQKVFFSPSEGATSVHVFYPQLLKNGTPDGRLWLRNVKCGTPQADGILRSQNSVRVEPGFGEAGENVTDVEIPLSEIPLSEVTAS
ncbi:hypothetical protein [Streptomyces sp. NPDC018693]|uniref:hypothetical protein n=1 Tax=unclassified Streptomyces TaxID=2593676 RepID=UPI00379101A5